jgi:hypothetical protein
VQYWRELCYCSLVQGRLDGKISRQIQRFVAKWVVA